MAMFPTQSLYWIEFIELCVLFRYATISIPTLSNNCMGQDMPEDMLNCKCHDIM